MRLLEQLNEIAENSESLFRRALAKEDLKRFDKLSVLYPACADLAAFIKDGMYIGWTQNDMKTHEMRETLTALLEAYHAYRSDEADPALEARLDEAWAAFTKDRLEKLIHCL